MGCLLWDLAHPHPHVSRVLVHHHRVQKASSLGGEQQVASSLQLLCFFLVLECVFFVFGVVFSVLFCVFGGVLSVLFGFGVFFGSLL